MNELFINNKYSNWYYAIIRKASDENRIKLKRNDENFIYYEEHHIVPRSLGGSNDENNIVKLTAKEHFICHILLCKMLEGKDKRKMLFALKCMKNMQNLVQHRYTSKLYEYYKKDISMAYHIQLKGKSNFKLKGKPRSLEVKEKLKKAFSKSIKHKIACLKNLKKASLINKGVPRPEHLKKQWSEKSKNKFVSNETKILMSNSAKERSKIRVCCFQCKKELPSNSLGSHKRFCK